ncbi:MAG: DUF3800 domain-containing protein [Methanobrevibacter sp.]|jgi:hypothetical protein|nr:DUF3800 domain-containing protein [Candidatus Methanoflexus mossambicus]
MSTNMKLNLINDVSNIDFEIYSIIMNKKEKDNESYILESNINNIYMDIMIKLLKNKEIKKCEYFELDKFVNRNFENIFHEKILKEINNEKNISLKFLDSKLSKGIQFADLIAWCIFQKIERDNSKFFELIKDKLHIEYYKKLHN